MPGFVCCSLMLLWGGEWELLLFSGMVMFFWIIVHIVAI